MSERSTLPRLAALYLTTGHRVPPEVHSLLESQPDPTAPLDGWELPLDESTRYGEEPGTTILRLVPPAY